MGHHTAIDANEAAPARRPDTGTLGKAMDVVDIVARASGPIRFTDILARSTQPRGTLHRQLSNLVEEGLLALNTDHTYELGLKLLKYASKSWAANRFRSVAEPHLRSLHAATGETVHLGVLKDTEVIYLDKVEGQQAVRMYSQVGNASPVYCTGVGKAALSSLADPVLMRLIGQIEFRRFTDRTLCDADALMKEVETIRRTGIAYDREEHEIGIRCIAAPIFSDDRSLAAGVSVTGPTFRVTSEALEAWSGAVRATALAIMDDMKARLGPRA